MYIELSSLCFGILVLLGAAALIYLIILLYKLIQLLNKVNLFWDSNVNNFNKVSSQLPTTVKNFSELSDNLKVVSEVVTETAASAIDTKENIVGYVSIFTDILDIVRKVFTK